MKQIFLIAIAGLLLFVTPAVFGINPAFSTVEESLVRSIILGRWARSPKGSTITARSSATITMISDGMSFYTATAHSPRLATPEPRLTKPLASMTAARLSGSTTTALWRTAS